VELNKTLPARYSEVKEVMEAIRIAKFGYDPLEKANPASAVSSPGRGDSNKRNGRGGDYSLSAGGISN